MAGFRESAPRILLSSFFVFAGLWHFVDPEKYLKMMPPGIPAPLFMIYLSGVFEAVLGVLLLPRETRRPAGFGLIALLAAVFPVNIYAALNPGLWPGVPAWLFWARLPLQPLLMFWVWSAAIKKSGRKRKG